MDLRRADLHTHSRCSDGMLSPADLVQKARRHGVQALALTDHDCVDGLEEARAAGDRYGVEVVSGVELSVTVDGQEVHLLGYFFDGRHAGLRQHLAHFRQERYHRALRMTERLHEAGIPLPFEKVLEQAQEGVLGRPHVAAALVAAGYVPTYQDAFALYLKEGAPAYVAKPVVSAAAVLALLHDAGGLGVLAHPGHWTPDAVVMALVRDGLDGIETIHPAHDPTLTRYYKGMARDFGLIETGGSDYHGFRPSDETNFGRYTISYPQLERIRRKAA